MGKINFKESASKATSISELHNGRTKVDTSDLVGKELTISDFDIAALDDGTVFGVFLFEGMDGFYYNGGLVLTKIVKEWAEACGGLEEARAEYAKEKDKVKIKLTEGKTKDKQKSLVSVELL